MTQWILTSSLLIVVVLLIRKLAGDKLSARVRYALWGVVLLRLLIPVSIGESALSVQNWMPKEKEYTQVQTEPVLIQDIIETMEPAEPTQPSGVIIAESENTRTYVEWPMAIYVVGMVVVAAVFLLSNLRFWLCLRRSRVLVDRQVLPIYVTAAIETPCMYGLLRPAVYVTPAVLADKKAQRYVLAHELTHYRHGDHVWSFMRCVVVILHWYNPLVWTASFASQQDGELACDEGALRRVGEENRREYARTLIDLTCVGYGGMLTTATSMTGRKCDLRNRVVRISKNPKMSVTVLVAVLVIAAVVAVVLFTGAAAPQVEGVWRMEISALGVGMSQDTKAYMEYEFFDGWGMRVDVIDGQIRSAERFIYAVNGDEVTLEFYETEHKETYNWFVADDSLILRQYRGELVLHAYKREKVPFLHERFLYPAELLESVNDQCAVPTAAEKAKIMQLLRSGTVVGEYKIKRDAKAPVGDTCYHIYWESKEQWPVLEISHGGVYVDRGNENWIEFYELSNMAEIEELLAELSWEIGDDGNAERLVERLMGAWRNRVTVDIPTEKWSGELEYTFDKTAGVEKRTLDDGSVLTSTFTYSYTNEEIHLDYNDGRIKVFEYEVQGDSLLLKKKDNHYESYLLYRFDEADNSNESKQGGMFERIFLPVAQGQTNYTMDAIVALLAQNGYDSRQGEGQLYSNDMEYPGSWISFDLTNDNGVVEVANVTYYRVSDNVERTARVDKLLTGSPVYSVGESFADNLLEVQSLEALKTHLYGAESHNDGFGTNETPSMSAKTILSAVEAYMGNRGYDCKELVQLGETYMLSGYVLTVVSGEYVNNGEEMKQVHLVHLDFENTAYSVINMYPGQSAQAGGYYPNMVNINGRTVIWTVHNEPDDAASRYNHLRLYFTDGRTENMPMIGVSSVFRLESGDQISKIVPVNEDNREITEWGYMGESLTPLANITYGNGAELDPMTGKVVSVDSYPEAPDTDSNNMLKAALVESGLMSERTNYSLISAKMYSGRLYACISYVRNGKPVYELVIAKLTIEGNIVILGVCEFDAPGESGYKMYSTAIENDIICWSLLNETRMDGNESVLMDFNAFRFYWGNGEYQDDIVVDRFFIYVNRHVTLPEKCTPIVNGNEVNELTSNITRVYYNPL